MSTRFTSIIDMMDYSDSIEDDIIDDTNDENDVLNRIEDMNNDMNDENDVSNRDINDMNNNGPEDMELDDD